MKVRDIMSRNVKSCRPEMNLAEAAEFMWEADCGVLPVMADGKLAAIITDRDICIALGTRNLPASELLVKDVATDDVQTCAPDADVHAAMATMRRAKVRRLPVVTDGKLEGILALNDIVDAVDRKHGDITYEEVMNTMKAICEHPPHKVQAAAAPQSWPPIAVAVA